MLKRIKKIIIKNEEIIKYLIVGGLTTLISCASYALFTRVFELDFKISTVLSWIISVIFAFFANKIAVFKSKTDSKRKFFREIFNFFKYRILSLVIDFLLMVMLVDLISINDLIAKIIVQVIIIIVNYVFSKFLVFNR